MVDEAVAIQAQWKSKAVGKNAECSECERYLSDPEIVKIYYDSGHTIAQGRCYEGGYSDQPFDWEHVDFSGYDVTKEKPTVVPPLTLAKSIAVKGDDSLFAYVVKKMFSDSAGKPTGWLESDDGSMEIGRASCRERVCQYV